TAALPPARLRRAAWSRYGRSKPASRRSSRSGRLLRLGGAGPVVVYLHHRHFTGFSKLLRDQIRELHCAQIFKDVLVQIGPQIVGYAFLVVLAVFLSTTLRSVDRLVHCDDNVRNGNLVGWVGQVVPATWAANACDERPAAQFAEQLFQVGQRYFL